MKESTHNYYKEAINRTTEYIETNFSGSIYLEDVAQHAHISPFHFHRIFKMITGFTINEFVGNLRMQKSAVLLSTSSKDVMDIAFECGYNSVEHFSRSFNKHFGISASQFKTESDRDRIQKSLTLKRDQLEYLIDMLNAPEIKKIDPIDVAYIRHYGSYSEVGDTWKRLIKWGYKKSLLGWKLTMIGIVHDNPEVTDENVIRYDACIAVRKQFTPEGEIGYKEITGGLYATFNFKGPYQDLAQVYDYIYTGWLFQSNYQTDDKPAFEMYKNNPNKEKSENLLTQIFIPLKK